MNVAWKHYSSKPCSTCPCCCPYVVCCMTYNLWFGGTDYAKDPDHTTCDLYCSYMPFSFAPCCAPCICLLMSQKNIGVVAEMAKTASENSKAREHENKRQTAMTILMDSAQYSKSPQELIAYRLELEQHPLGVLDSLVKATKMINKNSVDRKQKALELVRLRNEVAKEYADDVAYLGNIDDMSLEELDRWIAHYRSAKTRHATDKKQKEDDELKAKLLVLLRKSVLWKNFQLS
jgi:hypothetical protein